MPALRVLPNPSSALGWREGQLLPQVASTKASALVSPPFSASVSGRQNWWPQWESVQCHANHDFRRHCLQNGRRSAAAEEDLYGGATAVADDQDHELLLKSLASTVAPELKGSCIFLIGMMGCGKSTVGKVLAKSLGYFFFDTDTLIEQAAGATVAELFAVSEANFREAETTALSQLSGHVRLVVATGGGAVVRSENWGYLRHGVTVWLNAPVGALAKRVVAEGPGLRPLLAGDGTVETEEQVLVRLSKILEERGATYRNADATVCLEEVASSFGYEDSCKVTPTMIAIQILREILKLLRAGGANKKKIVC